MIRVARLSCKSVTYPPTGGTHDPSPRSGEGCSVPTGRRRARGGGGQSRLVWWVVTRTWVPSWAKNKRFLEEKGKVKGSTEREPKSVGTRVMDSVQRDCIGERRPTLKGVNPHYPSNCCRPWNLKERYSYFGRESDKRPTLNEVHPTPPHSTILLTYVSNKFLYLRDPSF